MKADVVVVGGGVAGLAAAHALAARGARVTLLERKPYFGGRAYSYPHPALGTVVDSQHVLLGCCTNLIDLLQRTGTAETVRWYDELVFLEPGGRVNRIAPGWMPAPLHSSLSFLSAPMLGVEDKLGIARALMDLMHPRPLDDNESMAGWLQRTGQTKKSIRRFWDLTVSVTLNDSLENCSLRYGAKVFRELLLKSVAGGRLGIPMLPLSDLYGRVAESIVMLGGEVALRADVDGLLAEKNGRWRVHSEAGEWSADAVVLAGSFDQVQQMLRMLPESAERAALDARLQRFVHSSIITTHLWFDREFTELHSAAMLDTMYQWIFHKSRIRGADPTRGSYVELVIGAANGLLKLDRSELIQAALDELQIFFPELAKCKLVKSGVLKEARATFSATPGLDAFRPGAATAWPGLYLAGDWTRTEWPSTMESAARGGYLAAEAVCSAANESATILVPDVAASGLMKMFG
jgi:zeta-carotene desaturase